MELTPAGCLELLWPKLSTDLIGTAARIHLQDAAAKLPPIPKVALEIRLGCEENQVDLHQLIVREEGDCAVLAQFLDRIEPDVIPSALRGFLQAWAVDNDATYDIDRVFLEWDSPQAGGFPNAPAIFVPIDLKSDPSAARAKRRQGLGRLLAQLRTDIMDVIAPEAIEDVHDDVSMSHIGIMLGRREAIRVNYRGIRRGMLPDILQRAKWPGDRAAAAVHFDAVIDMSDRVTVALDVHKHSPSLGFEIFLDHPVGTGPRWPILFEYLQNRASCEPGKCAALCAVPAHTRSYADDVQWPAPWIAATALAATAVAPSFRTDLSHLKLTISTQGALHAKAYITCQHFWREPPSVPRTLGALRRNPIAIEKAQARAVRFLLRTRRQNGLWGDFNGFNGGSDLYASALAGWALARCGDQEARRCAEELIPVILRRQRPGGGWGHNDAGPADSDDTASVLKFLHAAGFDGPQVDRAIAFLREHRLADGGFTSYGRNTIISFPIPGSDTRNWRTTHLCVAANCAQLLRNNLLPLLRRSQNADGSWTPFWWRTPMYATALAAEALANSGCEESVAAAVRWAQAVDLDAQTVFDAAGIVRILCLGNCADQKAGTARLERICETQLDDGSWPTGADMIVPPPEGTSVKTGSIVVPDDRRVFTTAAVIAAITAMRLAPTATNRKIYTAAGAA